MLKIEKFLPKHLEEVIEISREQFGVHGWQADLFKEELGKENHFAFVALCGAEVVSFVFVMKTYGERGEDYNILNIATKKSFENKGIATKLLTFLEEYAQNEGVFQLWLEVRQHNENAITFYKNMGFKLDYVRKNYYANGDNALVMSKSLDCGKTS